MAENTRVLIVDDEPLTGKVLSGMLAPGGCSCVIASGAGRALEMLSRYAFDLALVDIMMPGMSGLELLDVMKISRFPLPVIIITALNDTATVVQAMKKGAADYLVKPFMAEDVCRRVDTVLKEYPRPDVPEVRPVSGSMEAIARGVEAMVDHFDFHGRIVTERTIDVARQLAVPETDIRAWAAARRESQAQQSKSISLLSGLYGRCANDFSGQAQP
jgi:DNA-binding response OmpR family regulator